MYYCRKLGCLWFVVIFFTLNQLSVAYAEQCDVGNETVGTWEVICSGLECTCGVGSGAIVTDLGGGAFEAISDDRKIVEGARCIAGTIGGTSCGWPGGDNYEACCDYYFSNKPELKWPPCIQEAESYVEGGTSLCNPEVCDAYYNGIGCGMCDDQGGMYQRSGIYVWDMLFMKQLTSRTTYQWVCDSCTDEYNAKVQECGGSENIKNWDNATCTGECDPCQNAYYAKVQECEGEENIAFWDPVNCIGACKDTKNLGPEPCPKDQQNK